MLQPLQEVAGPVAEGAHAAGRHVQQVVGVAGGVGLAAAKGAVAFDESDADGRRTSAQKVQREQGAAETGTNYGDRRSSHLRFLPGGDAGLSLRGDPAKGVAEGIACAGTRGVRATLSRAMPRVPDAEWLQHAAPIGWALRERAG